MRDYGIGTAFSKSLLYFLYPVFQYGKYRIYRIRFRGTSPTIQQNTPHTFRLLRLEEDDIIGKIESLEEWLEGRVKTILRNRGLCIVAMDGDILAGFNLVSFGRVFMPIVNVARRFGINEAWSVQITVKIDYRNKGIGSALRYRMFHELKERGIKRFYGGTIPNNKANLRLTQKVGFREIVDIKYLRIFWYKRWFYKRISQTRGTSPASGISLSSNEQGNPASSD